MTSTNTDENKAGMHLPGYEAIIQAVSSSDKNLWYKDTAFTFDFNF